MDMTMRQTAAILKIIDREHRREMREQLTLQVLATHGDPEKVLKMAK